MCQESRLGRLVWSGLVWMVLNSRPLMNQSINDKGGHRAARAAKKNKMLNSMKVKNVKIETKSTKSVESEKLPGHLCGE